MSFKIVDKRTDWHDVVEAGDIVQIDKEYYKALGSGGYMFFASLTGSILWSNKGLDYDYVGRACKLSSIKKFVFTEDVKLIKQSKFNLTLELL